MEAPFKLIHFLIILQHKDQPAVAKLLKRKINADLHDETCLKSIKFNRETKTFEYFLIEPQVGYFYRLKWER